MKVNGKCYTRLDCLGRGGSGKVYRVAADNGKMFALKRVSVEGADENTVRGLKGEIDLLKKLTSVDRVVTLFDYDMNEEKQVLSLLMEMGEMDFNTLLRLRLSPEDAKFDPVFVRYYWQEMLECLSAVHAHNIVHSDLKPANFVLVQGRLKLIDFGIANAIQTEETVNVHRETQVGTPSYMSPESLIDSNTADPNASRRVGTNGPRPKLVKLGKPSDIWSLGCILFQMVYGQSPFGHIPNQMARCHAIINWQYAIEFRDRGIGDVPVPTSLLRTMKRCLNRDQHVRPTCEELLSYTDAFLYPVETPSGSLPISEDLLGRIVQSVVARCRERMPTDAEAMSVWPQAYWNSVAKASGKDPRSFRASAS
ncbi:putative Serine/threonine-protein kinase mph1 [Microdochium bolleyi]|uniref:Putative Serine/threonine-protein kinase mph1 n=1 Tax=Microdochium bolleyi TaxID=196109 RepID=A0A136J446_9PEZI|nr:putative Serine/threonine-protein kinase mph1 [Microdochium bolleyi]